MYLLLFDIANLIMVYIAYKLYCKQITPLFVLDSVYVLLININNLFVSHIYSFNRVENKTLLVLLEFNIVIFAVDCIFAKLYRSSRVVSFDYSIKFRNYKFINLLFIIGVVAYCINFGKMYQVYGMNAKGQNNGVLGHLSSLAYVLGPVALDLALKSAKKFRICITAVLNCVVLLVAILFGGKYVVFINMIYFLLYFMLKRERKIELLKLFRLGVILLLVAVIVFIILYYFIPRMTGEYNSSLGFALEHMFYYLLSPIIAQNYCVANIGLGDAKYPFAVFINIFYVIIGNSNYIIPINRFIFPYASYGTTNVAGMIGELIYNLGIGNAIIYFGVFMFFVNLLYYQYRTKNRFYLSMCYVTSVLAFSFFSNFMSVSGVFFPLLFAMLVDVLSNCKIGSFHI